MEAESVVGSAPGLDAYGAEQVDHSVAKHARASRAIVRLCLEKAGAEVEISDDGRGFPWRAGASDSYGLRTMREWAEQLGGTLEIDTQPGAGTRVRARLPAKGGPSGA